MSETWSSLLAGVVGAIVGGAASLAGTVLVNRMQMATNARVRMFEELLPRLERALGPYNRALASVVNEKVGGSEQDESVQEALTALARTGSIAGRQERAHSKKLLLLWVDKGRDLSPDEEESAELQAFAKDFANEMLALMATLQAKLG
jgi:hypothetical protein